MIFLPVTEETNIKWTTWRGRNCPLESSVLSVGHSSFVFFMESSELSFEVDITIIIFIVVVVVIPQFHEAYLKSKKVKVQTPLIQSWSRIFGHKDTKGSGVVP